MGRPTKYKPQYDEMLVEHCRRGYTFESFGAVAGVPKQTLYAWLKKHKSFQDAKKLGEPLMEMFYLKMGHTIALGQARRVVSEEPVLAEEPVVDAKGNPVKDSRGRPLMRSVPVMDPANPRQALVRREYAPAATNATAFIWMTKNCCGWRDQRDINLGGQDGNPVTHAHREMTREERAAEIARLAALREATDDE